MNLQLTFQLAVQNINNNSYKRLVAYISERASAVVSHMIVYSGRVQNQHKQVQCVQFRLRRHITLSQVPSYIRTLSISETANG